jgi:hypothetical protein
MMPSICLPAVAQSAPGVPQLRSTWLISSNGPGHAVVRLSQPLSHPFGSADATVTVRGPGVLDGVVLTRHGVPLSKPSAALVVGNLPESVRTHPTLILGRSIHNPLPRRLAAGLYDMYVSASGPVTVQVGFPDAGLPGGVTRIEVGVTRLVKATVVGADISAGVAAPVFAAGHTFQAPLGGAFTVSFDWFNAPAQLADISGTCIYPGGAPVSLQYSIPNECAGGAEGELEGIGLVLPGSRVHFSWGNFPRGTWGQKDYWETGAVPTAGGMTFISVGSQPG